MDVTPAIDHFYIALHYKNSRLLRYPYFIDQEEEAPFQKLREELTEYVLRTGKAFFYLVVNNSLWGERREGQIRITAARAVQIFKVKIQTI